MPIYSAEQIYHFARVAGFSPDQAVTMTAIALSESGGDSHAHNPHGEDSRGLWQINLRAHAGWASGLDLYDPADNARAAFEVSHGGADVSPWTTTHGGENARYLDYREEAQAAAVASGDPSHLGVWTGTEGYGHPLAAGGDGGADPLADGAFQQQALAQTGEGAHHDSLDAFLHAALAQTGDHYVFGAEAAPDNPDPHTFDCSELTQWAAHRAGVDLPDGSWQQYLELEKHHAVIPVEQAIKTPGALLFSFSSEPTAGGGRPEHAHVAISLGNGHTIEARGRSYGVGSFGADVHRFNYAALIPGISGGTGDADGAGALPPEHGPADADHGGTDSDHDMIGDAVERALGTDPHSPDTDHDGLTDRYELIYLHTDPTNPLDNPLTGGHGALDAAHGPLDVGHDVDPDPLHGDPGDVHH